MERTRHASVLEFRKEQADPFHSVHVVMAWMIKNDAEIRDGDKLNAEAYQLFYDCNTLIS